MENINWNAKQAQARKMTWDQLVYARKDCIATAEAMGNSPMRGKDASYYYDEASVYWKEMQTRKNASREYYNKVGR